VVAMLAHLQTNNHSVFGINQQELYSMIKDVAMHKLSAERVPPRRKNVDYTPAQMDEEVAAIANWLRKRARKIKRGEQQVTYRQLSQILHRHGYRVTVGKGTQALIEKRTVRRRLLLGKQVEEWEKIGKIG